MTTQISISPPITTSKQSSSGIVMGVNNATGDNAVDVGYSTKPDTLTKKSVREHVDLINSNYKTASTPLISSTNKIINTTTNTTTEVTNSGIIMGVGGGIMDGAADITYSTKPDVQTNTIVEQNINSTSTIVQNKKVETISTTGNIMTVGGGVGDDAVDVTYSSKPDIKIHEQI